MVGVENTAISASSRLNVIRTLATTEPVKDGVVEKIVPSVSAATSGPSGNLKAAVVKSVLATVDKSNLLTGSGLPYDQMVREAKALNSRVILDSIEYQQSLAKIQAILGDRVDLSLNLFTDVSLKGINAVERNLNAFLKTVSHKDSNGRHVLNHDAGISNDDMKTILKEIMKMTAREGVYDASPDLKNKILNGNFDVYFGSDLDMPIFNDAPNTELIMSNTADSDGLYTFYSVKKDTVQNDAITKFKQQGLQYMPGGISNSILDLMIVY